MYLLYTIHAILALLLFACCSYQLFYLIVPLFRRALPHRKPKPHVFAVLICARNEAAVIGQLIQSIRQQTYDCRLIRVFVMADNCTDQTAAVAKAAGATVFERQDSARVGKGYALQTLLSCVHATCPPDAFDGYFVFDADNLLDEQYIEAMNRVFSDGYDVVTGYRGSKNYGDSWISAGQGLSFLRDTAIDNRARMLLGVSCHVTGTGFLFSRELLERCGGWPFTSISEDTEFTMHCACAGEQIGYCHDAVLYDEQPVRLTQCWRQRKRWARGYWQVWQKYRKQLASGALRGHFGCYDMLMCAVPAAVLCMAGFVIHFVGLIAAIAAGQGLAAAVPLLGMLAGTCLTALLYSAALTFCEWDKIHAPTRKKLRYMLTYPLFVLMLLPIMVAAFLSRDCSWQPIAHTKACTLEQIRSRSSQ